MPAKSQGGKIVLPALLLAITKQQLAVVFLPANRPACEVLSVRVCVGARDRGCWGGLPVHEGSLAINHSYHLWRPRPL